MKLWFTAHINILLYDTQVACTLLKSCGRASVSRWGHGSLHTSTCCFMIHRWHAPCQGVVVMHQYQGGDMAGCTARRSGTTLREGPRETDHAWRQEGECKFHRTAVFQKIMLGSGFCDSGS